MEIIDVAPGAGLYIVATGKMTPPLLQRLSRKKAATKLVFPQIEDLETTNRKKLLQVTMSDHLYLKAGSFGRLGCLDTTELDRKPCLEQDTSS